MADALIGHQLSVANMDTIFREFKPAPGHLNVVFLSVMAGDGSQPFLARRKGGGGVEPAWSSSRCGKGRSYGEPGLFADNVPDCSPAGGKALTQALF